jgi:HK97 family phage major capsid protein
MKSNRFAGLMAGAAPRAVCALRAEVTDPKALVEQINADFGAFKERIDALEKKDDVITKDEVDRINTALTDATKALETLQAAAAAAKIGGGGKAVSPEAQAHADAFDKMFRKGVEAGNMRELEVKAGLTTQSDPDGGYLVPEEMEGTIDRVLGTVSAVRSISRVINVSSDSYKKLVNQGGTASGWVGEEAARPETDGPSLREIVINTAELYANPASTQKALDDARIDVAQWLADEVAIEFAEQEGAAFVSGDGINKPMGFLAETPVANASYAWGSLGYVVTGAAAAFATPSTSVSPADALISLVHALKQGYRNGATFIMNDAVMGTVRSFKDANGAYIWAPPSATSDVATILGKPVVTDDNMPALGAGAFPIAFGNFQRGYLIVDRMGVRVLRDPYTNKPNVHFYTTKRVGAKVVNFEAIKLLKCST